MNSKWFHLKASERKKQNTILRFKNNLGEIKEAEEDITQIVVDYFKDLFISSNPNNFDSIVEKVEPRVISDMNYHLRELFTQGRKSWRQSSKCTLVRLPDPTV